MKILMLQDLLVADLFEDLVAQSYVVESFVLNSPLSQALAELHLCKLKALSESTAELACSQAVLSQAKLRLSQATKLEAQAVVTNWLTEAVF